MAIIINHVTFSMFQDAFENHGCGNSFSYEGLCELYDHLESLSGDVDLDPVAIASEYIEVSLEGVISYKGFEDDEPDEDGEIWETAEDKARSHINDIGYIAEVMDGVWLLENSVY